MFFSVVRSGRPAGSLGSGSPVAGSRVALLVVAGQARAALVGVVGVAEADVVELNLAALRRVRVGVGPVDDARRDVEDAEDALDAHHARLEDDVDLAEPLHREVHEAQPAGEGDEHAGVDGIVAERQQPAEQPDRRRATLGQRLAGRLGDGGEHLLVDDAVVVLLGFLAEAVALAALGGRRLHERDAGQLLLHVAADLADRPLHELARVPDARPKVLQHDRVQRQDRQRHEGERHADPQEEADAQEDRPDVHHDRHHAAVDELGGLADVGDDAADDAAGPLLRVEVQAQPVQVAEQVLPQVADDAEGELAGEVAAQVRRDRVGHERCDGGDRQPEQPAIARGHIGVGGDDPVDRQAGDQREQERQRELGHAAENGEEQQQLVPQHVLQEPLEVQRHPRLPRRLLRRHRRRRLLRHVGGGLR